MTKRLHRWWQNWGAYGMVALFVAVFFWATSRQFATFDTLAPDLERFNQALWNTLYGRFMYSTIEERSVLSGHFSPLLITLAPSLLIWPDPRMPTLIQTVGLAATGLILYHIVRDKHPVLAPWFLLAFYLNPGLHDIATLELRRIPLAMPFLALGLYGLYKEKRWLMAAGLFLAVMGKEDVAIVVAMIGFYLFVFERDYKWGSVLMVLGAGWLLAVIFWISPALDPRSQRIENRAEVYRGLTYFYEWGNTLPAILTNMLRAPIAVAQRIFGPERLAALWQTFLPLGVLLPFLSPGWVLMTLPTFGYLLLSEFEPMYQLREWYLGPILPVLFAAVAVAIAKRPLRQARWITLILLAASIIGFFQYSRAPLGGRFVPIRYQLLPHHARAAEVVTAVPDDARVAAQSAYTPHLSHREILYLYPWAEEEDVDYYVLDRYLKSFPLNELERNEAINNLVSDPDVVVEMEVDGIYLIRNGGQQLPAFPVDRVAEASIRLDRVEVAPADERGYFQTVTNEPITLRPGQQVRVTLYWEALATPEFERTVSVRIQNDVGQLVAQHDMMPVNGAKPTTWWQPGWQIRDVYYLTVAPDAAPGSASLDILLYDSYSLERVPFDTGEAVLHIADVELLP